MDVVILCGGKGTRIREVTEDLPKPMIPIGGRPILWHIMRWYAHFGFKRFILCLGYKSWAIKQYFLDYALSQSDFSVDLQGHNSIQFHTFSSREDWHVTLAETGLETMTGGRVKQVAKYIKSDHFMLTYGDGVTDLNIHSLVDFHKRQGKMGTVTAVTPPGRFGEIELDGPQVLEFSEKPLLSRGRISGGFFVFQRNFLDRLSDDPDLILERDPLQQLARDGQMTAYLHDGFWQCMDNSRDYHYLNELWDKGNAAWDPESCVPLRRVA
jgi:glucose-1-phosphate cytidylyltransferase